MSQKSTDTVELFTPDWCHFCGAWFPPESRIGQGICKEWRKCYEAHKEKDKK